MQNSQQHFVFYHARGTGINKSTQSVMYLTESSVPHILSRDGGLGWSRVAGNRHASSLRSFRGDTTEQLLGELSRTCADSIFLFASGFLNILFSWRLDTEAQSEHQFSFFTVQLIKLSLLLIF